MAKRSLSAAVAQGSWSSLLFVVLCRGIVFQAVNLVFRWRTGRALTRRAPVGTAEMTLANRRLSSRWG
jgi:hypothetical protein